MDIFSKNKDINANMQALIRIREAIIEHAGPVARYALNTMSSDDVSSAERRSDYVSDYAARLHEQLQGCRLVGISAQDFRRLGTDTSLAIHSFIYGLVLVDKAVYIQTVTSQPYGDI